MTEKALARMLKVQYTPTVLFVDGDGTVVARLNGYYPPGRFSAALDYVAGRHERSQPLGEYLRQAAPDAASPNLNEQAFFLKPPHDLRRAAGGKPLAVIFETRHCQPCDEMHREAFVRPEVLRQLRAFDVVRFALSDGSELTTPTGQRRRADAWARELGIAFTPTVVFFDTANREVFRIEGYLRPFHFATAFEYVARGGYRDEPQFQRFVQRKAERLRERGEKVELWR
jgi:thioredoxin-related protein